MSTINFALLLWSPPTSVVERRCRVQSPTASLVVLRPFWVAEEQDTLCEVLQCLAQNRESRSSAKKHGACISKSLVCAYFFFNSPPLTAITFSQ